MQRSLWHPLALVRVSSRLPAQELIDRASSSNPFGGRLQQLVRMRYKGLTLEQNVCAQLLLPLVRGATSTCLPSRGANRVLHCPRHRVAALID